MLYWFSGVDVCTTHPILINEVCSCIMMVYDIMILILVNIEHFTCRKDCTTGESACSFCLSTAISLGMLSVFQFPHLSCAPKINHFFSLEHDDQWNQKYHTCIAATDGTRTDITTTRYNSNENEVTTESHEFLFSHRTCGSELLRSS